MIQKTIFHEKCPLLALACAQALSKETLAVCSALNFSALAILVKSNDKDCDECDESSLLSSPPDAGYIIEFADESIEFVVAFIAVTFASISFDCTEFCSSGLSASKFVKLDVAEYSVICCFNRFPQNASYSH